MDKEVTSAETETWLVVQAEILLLVFRVVMVAMVLPKATL